MTANLEPLPLAEKPGPFQTELSYFIENQSDLVARYNGKALILRGPRVVGVHDTALQAYLAALRECPPGTFMIQPCRPGTDAYTVTLRR